MNKKTLKYIVTVIACGIFIWLFSNCANAAYLSVKTNSSTANPGQTVDVSISSDCVGKVKLSVSNGTVSNSSIWVEGSTSVKVTVGTSGTTTIAASPVDMSDTNGNVAQNIKVSNASISIVTNTPPNNNNGGNSSTNSGNGNSGTSTGSGNVGNTKTKSSNANLKNLGIRPNDFSGFKSGTTTYNVTVPNNVTSVELYAVKQDAKATISGTGQKTLQEGVNKLSVVVTAEDGTKKTYTVNVTREAEKDKEEPEKEEIENKVDEELENENNNNNEEIGEGLAELKIEGVELNKEFKIGEYEYTAKYIGEATSLNIEAIPSNENYVVEIIGNKDLKEGENIVTILVSDKDGNNIATYQITVNKSLVDEEAIAREEAKKQEEKKRNIIIFGSIASLVIIILIVVIIVKNKRKNSYGEDYSIPYSGINSENNLDNYYGDSNLVNDETDDDFKEPVKKVKRNKGKRFK